MVSAANMQRLRRAQLEEDKRGSRYIGTCGSTLYSRNLQEEIQGAFPQNLSMHAI